MKFEYVSNIEATSEQVWRALSTVGDAAVTTAACYDAT